MDSSVLKFFEGGHVLVTGGTGFMGKILVEKLLRVCSGMERLYLIIRVKKGKEPNARLKELFDDPVFGRLKSECPGFLSKVRVVAGDCSLPGMGLTESDRHELAPKLTHIFHGAATVRFDERLRLAVNINVLGVREMLKFCRECLQLKSIIHTSTAYSNCPLENIQEQFYPASLSGESALQLLDCMDDNKLDLITPVLIKPWPNTYSFTKAIGEEVVLKHGKGLPIAVFRPSIVIGTAEGPVKGWIDNLYGPTGVVVGVGAGLMRVLYADGQIMADLVPVDMAVNALICSAWEVSTQNSSNESLSVEFQTEIDTTMKEPSKEEKSDIPIYNYVVSRKNALTWKEYLDYNFTHGMKVPSNQAIWYYTLTITKVWAVYKLLAFFYHLIPAIIMDSGLLISGNKPQMWRAYQKIHKFSGVISSFSTREWVFGETNTRSLWERLSPVDRSLFNFDMESLDWDQYFRDSVEGIRLFLFKEQPSTLPAARRRMLMFRIAHHILQLVVYSLIGFAICMAFSAMLSSRPDILTQITSSRWASRKTLLST